MDTTTPAATTPPAEELLTVSELERLTKIKRNTLYVLAISRKIPSLKIGKMRRFRLSEVMTALESYRVDTRPAR
jgi:excisionase family DNA binding protein